MPELIKLVEDTDCLTLLLYMTRSCLYIHSYEQGAKTYWKAIDGDIEFLMAQVKKSEFKDEKLKRDMLDFLENPAETKQVIEMIPEEWKAGPAAMLVAFNELKKSKANWTFFSPAFTFDPEGPRTGKYKLGTDYLFNNRGRSHSGRNRKEAIRRRQ